MIQINRETCVRCGLCAANCCVHAIYQREDGSYACRSSLCFHCAQCVAICPAGAVSEPDLPPPVEYDSARFDISPENLLNTMQFRRSVRRFTGEKVSREELEKLLEAGRCAPTSSNSQTVRFTVLDREFEALRPRIWESFAALCEERGQKLLLRRYQNYLRHPDQPDALFYGANQMVTVTSAHAVDGALALANMELLAHTMGLGALYCGFAVRAIQRDEALRETFGATQTQQLIGCLLLGRTDLKFYRTAPRNPANVQWK